MIIIKNGERQIYNPKNPNLKLVNPKLILEDNAAGSLTFKIYNSNLNYNTLRKLYPIVTVERNGKIIFKGRVISDKKDFYNGKSVEVEGKLAFFNDSYMEPFEFSGSPKELFTLIVDNHNSQVKEWQKFKVGVVTVEDANDYIVRSSENIINSWDALKEKCFKSSLGGHVRIRYEEDGDYIDWLSDYETVSKQSIEFAKNMIDLSTDVDATETYTAIRPVGAEVEGKRINISSVNDGKNYLVNEEKAEEYGIIYAPDTESTWDDVTLPENLLKKAKEKLFGSFIKLKETYEIKAIDLNLTNDDIEALNICEYVPVISRPHEINGNYLLSKAEISISEPQNTVFYLGASRRSLSDMNTGSTAPVFMPKNISAFNNDAGYISEEKTGEILAEYSKMEEVKQVINNAVSNIPSGTDGASAYEIAVQNGFVGTESEWLEDLNGQDGKDGYTPEIGQNGNWFINNVDTGKPSRGESGAIGKQGTQGINLIRGTKEFVIDAKRIIGWNLASSRWNFNKDSEGFMVASISLEGQTSSPIVSLYSSLIFDVKLGDTFTISCYFMVDDVDAWDVKRAYIFEGYQEDGTRVQFEDVSPGGNTVNKPTVNSGEWVYVYSHHTVTNSNVTRVGCRLILYRNGSIHFKKAKMEVGHIANPVWTPAIEDLQGQDGFSPEIIENENNTDDVYKLDITTAEGTFTTPNLKGADAQDGKFLPLTGGTLTGPLTLKAISENLSVPGIYIRDYDGEGISLGYNRSDNALDFGVFSINDNGSITNKTFIEFLKSGIKIYNSLANRMEYVLTEGSLISSGNLNDFIGATRIIGISYANSANWSNRPVNTQQDAIVLCYYNLQWYTVQVYIACGYPTGANDIYYRVVNGNKEIKIPWTLITNQTSELQSLNIGYGTCNTAANVAAKEVTLVDNPNWELKPGSIVSVKFSNTNTASSPTLNVNGTGGKPIYYNTGVITNSEIFKAGTSGRIIQYMYDGTNYVFQGWSYDADSTYTPQKLGFWYGVCNTEADVVNKVVPNSSSYIRAYYGTVSIKFTYDVPAGATLVVGTYSQMIPIYYRGAAITAGVIKAGDVATFRYSGGIYYLIGLDRDFATNGLQFAQDAEGNWGYIAPGADTVTPFKKDSGSGKTIRLKHTLNGKYVSGGSTIYSYLYLINPAEIKSIKIVSGVFRISNTSSSQAARSVYLVLRGKTTSNSNKGLTIASGSSISNSTSQNTVNVSSKEISLDGFDLTKDLYFSLEISSVYLLAYVEFEYEIEYA